MVVHGFRSLEMTEYCAGSTKGAVLQTCFIEIAVRVGCIKK